MKKSFLFNLFAVTTLSLGAFSASANSIHIVGEGAGGTNFGDQNVACGRAYDRAEDDAEDQCFKRNGEKQSSEQGACNCHRKAGTHNSYDCHAEVRLSCDIPCQPETVNIPGNGLDIDVDMNVACGNAFRRAQDDTSLECSQRQGFIQNSLQQSCNCKRLSSGENECTSVIQSTCQVQSCQ